MSNEALFLELAKALARPSGAYRAASAALDIPGQALGGYEAGSQFQDKQRQRRLGQQTLEDALGGRSLEDGIMNLTAETGKLQQPNVTAAISLIKAQKERAQNERLQQGQFQYNGLLTRFNPIHGDYDALTPQGWKTIGVPADLPSGGVNVPRGTGAAPSSGYVAPGGSVSPRIPPTVPASESDFFGKADTLGGIFDEIKRNFKPEYVGPVQSRVNRAIDVYTPWGNEERSRYRNQVSKAFNNLIYLRSGKQINQEEANRMAEEFMSTTNSPVAFMSSLGSMQDEMNSLVANKRKALVQAGYRGAEGLGARPSNEGGIPSVGGMFNGGKVLHVEKIQ